VQDHPASFKQISWKLGAHVLTCNFNFDFKRMSLIFTQMQIRKLNQSAAMTGEGNDCINHAGKNTLLQLLVNSVYPGKAKKPQSLSSRSHMRGCNEMKIDLLLLQFELPLNRRNYLLRRIFQIIRRRNRQAGLV